jgi:hypothetical protein
MHVLFYGTKGVYDLWIGDRESSVSYVFERYMAGASLCRSKGIQLNIHYFLATKFCICIHIMFIH